MTISKTYLFKRANGIWYILYDVEGRRKWKSTKATCKSDALKYLDRFYEDSIQKSFEKPTKEQPKLIKLSSFIEEFLTYARVNYARASVNIFNVCLRNLRIIVGDCPLAAIDARHVDQYKTQALQKKSPVTVNVELRSLRTLFNHALRWKFIETNPFTKVQLVRIPEVPPVHFTRQEIQTVLLAIKQEWFKEIVTFTLLTGMRRGEVANLKWTDVDLTRKLAHVHSTPTFRSKWGKQRMIPLNEWIVQRLSERFSKNSSEYVFTFEGTKVAESYLSHKFTDYVRAAGLQKKLHFHSLRHTFATWLVQDGVSIYEIQKLLGHSSIEMTQVYSHLQSEQLHATVNRISPPTVCTDGSTTI
jgi:site-specific recombinase XerD